MVGTPHGFRPPVYIVRMEVETPNGSRASVQGQVDSETFESGHFDAAFNRMYETLKHSLYEFIGLRKAKGDRYIGDYLKAEQNGVKWER